MLCGEPADDSGMSIDSLPAVSASLVQDKVGIVVARKILDVAQEQGAASVAMIESAAKIVRNAGTAAADGSCATCIDVTA